MMKYTVVIILYMFIINASFAQDKAPNFTTIVEQNFTDTINIEFIKNKIIIPVIIEGEEKKYLFDTGSPLIISEELQASKKYKLLNKDIITDANGKRDSIEIVELREMKLGKINFRNSVSIVKSLESGVFECLGVDGIIGSNILKNLIVQIDIKNKRLIITNQKNKFKKDKGFTSTFKTNKHNLPIISILPMRGIKEEALFDTGDQEFFSLSNTKFKLYKNKKNMSNNIVYSGIGSKSIGFLGSEKDSPKYTLRLDDFDVNGLKFKNLYTITNAGSNSRLGADILNYGRVILDFIGHKFTFIPYDKVDTYIELPTRFKDFHLIYEDGKLKIGLIWEGSNAYEAGLRKGFIVEQINDMKIADICDTYIQGNGELDQDEVRLRVIDLNNVEKEVLIKNVE